MHPSCSARLLQPLMRFVATNGAHRDLIPQDFWSAHPDSRVSLEETHALLATAVERVGDDQLGLKLGRTMCFGSGGAFDYAVRSAATIRDSFGIATKYSKLLSDSFHVSYETWRDKALIRVENDAEWPRAAADFALSAFYKIHVAEILSASHLECWFPYSAPRDTREYQHLFGGASLKFGAPFQGFAFDQAHAQAPMPGNDPILHTMLCSRVDAVILELSAPRSLAPVVRRVVAEEIRSGNPSAPRVARALRMSRRTMTRRLEQEGTSFNAELDAVRRELVLDRVRDTQVPLTEIAFLAGFSHVESFHRAFKRWTGETPLCYRNAHAAAGR